MWIGTNSGLFVGKNRDKQMQRVLASVKPDSISNISGLMIDRLGILWVGTQDNGLYQVYQPDIAFQTIRGVQNFSKKEALCSILEVKPNVWLMGTVSGLYRYSFSTQEFFEEMTLDKSHIWCLLSDRNNGLWVATTNGVFYKPLGQTKVTHFVHDPQNENSLPFNNIIALAEDEYGNIWMGVFNPGGNTEGLCYYRPITKTITRVTGMSSESRSVSQIVADREHNIWVSALGIGLYHYRITGNPPPQSTPTHFTESSAGKHKISHDVVSCVRPGGNGKIWFGTVSGGMNLLDAKTDSVSWFTVKDGLASNLVYRIEEDDQGILWISTDQGISRFDPSTKTFTNHDVTSGLPTNNFAFLTSMKCTDGTIAFGTNTGDVVFFNPNTYKNSLNTQPVVISDIRLFNKSLETGGASPLKESAYLTHTLTLNYDQSVITFELANMDYLNPEVFTYAYKLEGFDNNWNYVSDQHSITYTNLDAGEYTLMLKQANHLGIWNENATLMKLIVTPPWWKTLWAYGSYAVVLITGLYSFRRYEKRRDRLKQQAELERVETEKRVQQEFSKQLIETQEVERSRLAGELHDSLVQNLLIAKNRSLIAQKKITDQETIGKDLGDISSVLDDAIEEVRKIAHNLRPYQLDRLGVTRALQALVNKVDEASTIRFRADLDNVDSYFSADTGIILFRIVQEGITNILKHSGATEANIVLKVGENNIELTIADNGKGMSSLSDERQTGGFGLSGIEQRCRMLQGSLNIASSRDEGTTLIIQIPKAP
jgi:signal transduction histidine kinase